MVVSIEQIRNEGLQIDEDIPLDLLASALDEVQDTGFRVVQGSRLSARLEKVSGGVLLRGQFQATAVGPCKRCLADVEVRFPVTFTLSLVPRNTEPGTHKNESEGEGSFRLAEVDEEVFDGKTIDLDPILREQMLLALPMYVVCDEDCQGLCPSCGQNLNEAMCGCEVKPVDPRLSALKNIKLN
jgi:uncharacterized protein